MLISELSVFCLRIVNLKAGEDGRAAHILSKGRRRWICVKPFIGEVELDEHLAAKRSRKMNDGSAASATGNGGAFLVSGKLEYSKKNGRNVVCFRFY